MNKDEIYFGEVGLTSTSASHISDKAKEYCASLEAELNDVTFITTTLSLLDSNDAPKLLSSSCTKEEITSFKDKLDKIALMKSLCAWLREAIKAKARLQDSAYITLEKWLEITGTEHKKAPQRPTYATNDDYLATLSVKDRNKMYKLETICSVYGKFIHTDGAFYHARKHLNKHLKNKVDIVGEGHNTMIKNYEPGVDPQFVEDTFFELNEIHRKHQAELNSMKHDMQVWVDKRNVEIDTEYKKQLAEYNIQDKIVMAEYSSYIDAQLSKVSNYKIIIPNALKEIYEFVNAL
jgi:hypothetical protein